MTCVDLPPFANRVGKTLQGAACRNNGKRSFGGQVKTLGFFEKRGFVLYGGSMNTSSLWCHRVWFGRGVFSLLLKSLWWLVRCRLDRLLERRLARLNPATKTLAEHTNRTEFHRSRKLVTAARAGALDVCAHSPSRPSAASSTESKTGLHREARNRPARPLANYCSVPQGIPCFTNNNR